MKGQNRSLAVGQIVNRVLRSLATQQLRDDHRIDGRSAGSHSTDCFEELVQVADPILQKVARTIRAVAALNEPANVSEPVSVRSQKASQSETRESD